MGVIIGISIFVGGILASIVLGLLVDDTKEWLKWAIDRLIQRAVRRLPQSYQSRLSEEWQSHINEIPGQLGKLVGAFGLIVASIRIKKVVILRRRHLSDRSAALNNLSTLARLDQIKREIDYVDDFLWSMAKLGFEVDDDENLRPDVNRLKELQNQRAALQRSLHGQN